MFRLEVLLALFCVLALTGCATIQGDWEKAEELDTLPAYQEFLSKHPQSEYTSKAESRMESLAWQKAQRQGTLGSYQEFIDKYPQSRFVVAAKAKILEAKAIVEEFDWKRVERLNTVSGYETFLQKNPTSKFASDAKKKIETLAWEKASEANTAESLQGFVQAYPQSEFVSEAKDKLAKLEEAVKFKKTLETVETPAQLEQLLAQHPDMETVIVPKLEQSIIAQIQKEGVGDRLVIEEIMPQTNMSGSMTLEQASKDALSVTMEFPGDAMPIVNNRLSIFGHRCIHRFKGRVELDVDNVIYTFIGGEEKRNRLTFVMIRDIGYVYLRGRGSVILQDGKEVKLGDRPA